MPRYRYYYEHNPVDNTWPVLEEDAVCEHGDYFDEWLFDCASEYDAKEAVKVLIELASKTLTKQKE